MKKPFSLFLAAVLLATLAACGTAPAESGPAGSAPAESLPADSSPAGSASADSGPADSDPATPEADAALAALLESIYAEYPLDIPALESLPVTLDDTAQGAWEVGLCSGEMLKDVEAGVISASMINVHAYTMALLRLKDGADLAVAGQTLLDDANAQKWVCVFPDAAAVAGQDGVLCFVIADSEVADAEALTAAFASVMGGAAFSAARTFDESELGGDWIEDGAAALP